MEAQGLYADLDPPAPRSGSEEAAMADLARRDPGAGRPSKRERRETMALRRRDP
jgi:ribosome-associated heat shock protein Hsp15